MRMKLWDVLQYVNYQTPVVIVDSEDNELDSFIQTEGVKNGFRFRNFELIGITIEERTGKNPIAIVLHVI